MQKKILGVLGGMGPAASARFYALLTEFTAAEKDSDHMEILLHSLPTIPDRTEFILGRSKSSPLPMMESAVLRLAQNGAQIIALPCNTAEYFYSPLKAICPVPILRAAKESARIAKVRGVKKGRAKIIESIEKDLNTRFADVAKENIRIATAGTFRNSEDAEKWRKEVEENFPGFDVIYFDLGCSVGTHVGPEAFAAGIYRAL
jgi:aspartate/glutamate racemase